jgi:hypothetical protein
MNSQVCVHAERDEYRRLLASLAYPVSEAAILRKALDIGGIDTEVVKAVRLLPDRPFGSETRSMSITARRLSRFRSDRLVATSLGPTGQRASTTAGSLALVLAQM